MKEENKNPINNSPEGTATHSGWREFYYLFSKYRDECLKIGQIVFGANQKTSISYLMPYHSSLYSMAQQVFSFYDEEEEDKLTTEWLNLQKEINDALYLIGDVDFRNKMLLDGEELIPTKLKVSLLKYFNKINRLAARAGLLVGQENNGSKEPKKGLVGFK